MDKSTNSEKNFPDRRTILLKWVWYPTVAGVFFGTGHFIAYYISLHILKLNWFRKMLKYIWVDLTPLTA
jgi:hypothetical protein